jgi:hypothetical protein
MLCFPYRLDCFVDLPAVTLRGIVGHADHRLAFDVEEVMVTLLDHPPWSVEGGDLSPHLSVNLFG